MAENDETAVAGPEPLAQCRYPGAADRHLHGMQPLPTRIPPVSFDAVRRYRSDRYTVTTLDGLPPGKILETAREVARSFALREPMGRYLQPPDAPPDGLMESEHTDPLGTEPFGPWTRDNIIYWLIRQFVLTNATSPVGAIEVNREVLSHSLAMLDADGRVMGGAFSEIMPMGGLPPEFRKGDIFLDAVIGFLEPVMEFLGEQEAQALAGLARRYTVFREASVAGQVGHHFLVARTDALPRDHAFELVAATAEHFQRHGCGFMGVEATNQWTGAACEALGGVPVHFAPYRAHQRVASSATPLPDQVSSPDGYLSDKDSGSMFYLINLSGLALGGKRGYSLPREVRRRPGSG